MKVQFCKETQFFNIFKFSSERWREGERNARLNQERPSKSEFGFAVDPSLSPGLRVSMMLPLRDATYYGI